MKIPYNKPYMTGKELWYISQAHANGHLDGDGDFTRKCHAWLENHFDWQIWSIYLISIAARLLTQMNKQG